MKTFKHPNNLRNEPRFRAIEKELGEAGYARALKLFEIVAERGGKGDEFVPEFALRGITDLDWLADEWRISPKKAQRTLEIFATVELIDPQAWSGQTVRILLLLEYLDEHTQRRKRPRESAATPESVRSESGATPARANAKPETESARLPVALHLQPEEPQWKAIGIPSCGSPGFREIWATTWAKCGNSEKVSDALDRCLDTCQAAGIQVPREFLDAKRRVDEDEFNEEIGALEKEGRLYA